MLATATAPREAAAQVGQTVKPYVVFVMDVSGSMGNNVSGTPESCSGGVERIDHAKCALQQIVNAYGDVVISLGKFRQTTNDSNCGNGCSMSTSCIGPTGEDPDTLELLVPLLGGNQYDVLDWVDFTCGTCQSDPLAGPEIFAGGSTPLAGSLYGAQRYYQGLDPTWMSLPGGDPIRDDPLKDIFSGGAQCRPYLVILLTDGNEACGGDPPTAAAALLSTMVAGESNPYVIQTKPIGFGMTPCDSDIEEIAHAGGAPDDGDPNTCEGFYAANESELAVAISQIIADSLKFEQCNDLDDDCDLLVDEDFSGKGQACDDGQLGICRGTGTLQCAMSGSGLACVVDTPGQPATTETCNALDDDCDGLVDEAPAVCTGCGGTEICDGLDNDCDLKIDEGLTRSCGTNVGECTAGTETCMAGTWTGCDATGPFTEVCDGLDNDCDGTVDGFAQACTNMPDPPGNPQTGICQPGIQVCPSDGSGVFGPCLGEIVPAASDLCDAQDNDCDTRFDEDYAPTACTGTCGQGMTVCNAGVIECQSSAMAEPEICDGLDNDCDNLVDEALPDMGPCDEGGTLCVPGVLLCIGGTYQCTGGQPPAIEVCDCSDNDCDGMTDEEPPALCGSGQACIDCQCASPCSPGEFPCPVGQECRGGFCLADPCYNVNCPPDESGDKQECLDGACVPACDLVTCPPGLVCRGSDGTCRTDDCFGFPERCDQGQVCIAGECVSDPCAGVDCPGAGEYCYEGQCITSCANVTCPYGQRCVRGECAPNPCGASCASDEVCNEQNGTCQYNPCIGTTCSTGQYCDPQNGTCQDDPCVAVTCPGAGEVCFEATCYRPGTMENPRPVPDRVTPGGNGCNTTKNNQSPFALLLVLLAGYLAGRRRRKRASLAQENVQS